MSGVDLFPDTVPPADPLIGTALAMNECCGRCGTNVAIICAGDGPHHAQLRCRNCDQHWQWLSRADYETTRTFLAEITDHFGAPSEIKYNLIKQRSELMSDQQYDNTNRGVLFKNSDKQNRRQHRRN
jgi:hypothetical protein